MDKEEKLKLLTEEKTCYPIPNNDDILVVRSTRDMPPAHYTFKVKSFSLLSEILSKTTEEKYVSDIFEAGGYKWRLSLYPNGRKDRNGNGHISLYLVIAETDTLPLGWEVNVVFNLFMFDQIRDKYLTFQDANGGMNRFHRMKTECGFAQLMSLSTLNDASNGYLVDDSCVFGVEVFVIRCTGKGECLSMLKTPNDNTYTWKIENFSTLTKERYDSQVFTIGEYNWKLSIHPKGVSSVRGRFLSLALHLNDWKLLPPGRQLYAGYWLRIRDQIHDKHEEITDGDWFAASAKGWSYAKFLSLSDLHNTSKGFLVNDTMIVEGGITVTSAVKNFS